MLLLLKKKNLSNSQGELHLWGCEVLPHLDLYLLVTETFREAQMLPGMVSMPWGLCWSQCERCSRVAAVISCVLPMQWCVPFLSAGSWLSRCIVKGIVGGHNSFVLPRCLFHVCLISISLTVGFSLILYLMYGLSKLRLPQNRVLAHIPQAFWVFWNLLPMQGVICDLALHWCIDRFLFFNWQSCWLQLPSGTTCLKAGVGALLLCVLFPWTVFCEEVFRISSISRVHVPTAGCWGGRAMDAACLGICFPEPCVGWERSEITTPVCSLNVLYECYDKFWEALYFWEVNSQFYTFRSFMDPQVR